MAYKPVINHQQKFPRGEAHTFDKEAFLEAIKSQGVTLVHYRAMGCPFGIVNKDDTTRTNHDAHAGCSNGYLYRKMKEVTCLFIGNADSPSFVDAGQVDGSTVQATIPHEYDDRSLLYVAPYDRFYLAEEAVLYPNWEVIEHSITGKDKLRWPAVEVQHVINNRLVEYTPGADFEVRGGEIHWVEGGRRPEIDMESGRGRACTVWYLYRPFWYVQRLSHENRIGQEDNALGERVVTRYPFQGTLVREHVFETAQRAEEGTEHDTRERKAPPDGSFPAR